MARKRAFFHLGCAGWSLPRSEQLHFSGAGSHLERYAARFTATEINSTFYRPHQPKTFLRWSEAVPATFRFSLKFPKAITHELRLKGASKLVKQFLTESASLGGKLGCFLVQLPPSLEFDAGAADAFFEDLRSRTALGVACEPRNESWFGKAADSLLRKYRIARAAADPARTPAAADPGGWRGLCYYRLHGSPRMYYSEYSKEFLERLAGRLRKDRAARREIWCIFDNTTLGAATRNALELSSRLGMGPAAPPVAT